MIASLVLSAALGVSCADLPNPLYLQVGDTQEPLVKKLGRALRDSNANPMTLVYLTSGSCTNIEAMYTDVKLTGNVKYIPSTAEDSAWTTSSPSPQCTVAAEGQSVDIANSALFVSACNPDAPPAGISLFQGPVQAYLFVTPEASTQVAITAEEAYFVFGFGADGQVTPWDDEAFMFIRTPTKSTLLTLAANIGVPGAKWHGTPFDKSTELLNAITASTAPEKSIGILGSEIFDAHRDTLNALAFRGYGQRYAYYPDSTATSFDKRNVRDGHYLPWSPTVWLTRTDNAGVPTNANAKYLIDLILGHEAAITPDFSALDKVIEVGLVPECAMGVTRSYEGGPLSLYEPEESCVCYYESKVATSSCATCDDTTECATGVCRNGFCEER